MKKTTYLVLGIIVMLCLINNELKAQDQNRGGSSTYCPSSNLVDGSCDSGNLEWVAIEGAKSYELIVSYKVDYTLTTESIHISSNSVSMEFINNNLIPFPDDSDISNPQITYTLTIIPHEYDIINNLNNGRYILGCTLKLGLALCINKDGGGSKAFVPIDDGIARSILSSKDENNSNSRTCDMEFLDFTYETRCRTDGGYLLWTDMDNTAFYKITTSYKGNVQSMTTPLNAISVNYILDHLSTPPSSSSYNPNKDPYTLMILHFAETGSPSRVPYYSGCYIEAELNFCYGKTGAGGSKAFVPIDDGGNDIRNTGKTYYNDPQSTTNIKLAPNPVQNQVIISTQLNQTTKASIIIYNAAGQQIESLYNQQILEAGSQQLTYNTEHLKSGIYYLVLQTETETISQKLVKLP